MGYELQEPEKTNQTPPPAPAPEVEKKKAAPTGDDLIPAENKVAKDDKDKGKPAKEEVTEKEAARRAAVAEKWEDSLGKWLGGPLAKLVLEHVSLDSLNSYVQEGLKAAGPALGGVIKGAVKPKTADQEAALKAYSTAVSGVMTGLVEKWMASPGGQKVLKGISSFIQGHPGWTMTIVGAALIGGGIGAWFANADLSNIEIPLGLPKGWDLKLGMDLGTIQNIGFHGAAISVANKAQGFAFDAKGSSKEKDTDKDDGAGGKIVEKKTEGSATVKLGKDKEPQFTFGVNGSIVETSDGLVIHSTGKKIELIDPINGVKITIDETGKWDTKGNKDNTFTYAAKAGKEDGLNGSFNFTEKSATVVDASGNVVNIASREVGVAVGAKGLKFGASSKTEEKDGKASTTTKANASAAGQLNNLTFKADTGVSITDDVVSVKIGAGVTAKVGDKTIELAGTYETDGPVTGRVRIGGKDEYVEVSGEKKGNVITFKTKDVFPGGSHTKESAKDEKTGAITEKESVQADLGKGQSLNMSNGTAGGALGYSAKGIGGSPLNVSSGIDFDPAGQVKGGNVSAEYDTQMLKIKLDAIMKDSKSSFGASVGVKTEQGFKFDANVKVDDGTLKTFGTSIGYTSQDETLKFLAGYKKDWLSQNAGYEDKFDAMVGYSMGRFSTRFAGDMTMQGGQVKSAKADLGIAYAFDKKQNWQAIAGATATGTFNDPGKSNSMMVNPYIGLGHKPSNVSVMFNYNPTEKTTGFTISKWF